METITLKPYIVVLLLLMLTGAALAWLRQPEASGKPAVAGSLPDRVAGYAGRRVLYCQNEQCLNTVVVGPETNATACPLCSAPLARLSPAEKRLLPEDTVILRRQYVQTGMPGFLVSVVISGSDRTSIHRPQMCITGQGFRIANSRTVEWTLAGGDSLDVMLLDVEGPATSGQRVGPRNSFRYAYWFVGDRGHETPYHLERMFWTAYDHIVHARAPRWAYITVFTPETGQPESDMDRMAAFVRALYPHLHP